MEPGPGLAALKRELAQAAEGNRAGYLAWFKMSKGEYGEGDKFIGVRVPAQRAIAEKYHRLGLDEIEKLLESPIHEHRFTGLLILMAQFEGGYQSTKRRIFGFYLNHTRCVNNWDLVDASAPLSSGSIWSSDHDGFYIVSPNHPGCGSDGSRWWRRRRSSTHKATGWMLREAGKHSRSQLVSFLKRHYSQIPRTTLRCAIEHLPEAQRKKVLRGIFC